MDNLRLFIIIRNVITSAVCTARAMNKNSVPSIILSIFQLMRRVWMHCIVYVMIMTMLLMLILIWTVFSIQFHSINQIHFIRFKILNSSVIILFFFFSSQFWQGKGLMNTYWLTCREGPTKKREEISWFTEVEPVFLKTLQTRQSHEIRTKSKKSTKL